MVEIIFKDMYFGVLFFLRGELLAKCEQDLWVVYLWGEF